MKLAPYFALTLTCLVGTTAIALEHTKDSMPTVKENIAAKKTLLVDVREKEEWDGGHVANALLLPLSSLEEASEVKASLKRLPKDRIIYTHCAVGVRSLKAAELLKKHGYDVRPESGLRRIAEGRIQGRRISRSRIAAWCWMKPLAEHSGEEIKSAVAERYGLVATSPGAEIQLPGGTQVRRKCWLRIRVAGSLADRACGNRLPEPAIRRRSSMPNREKRSSISAVARVSICICMHKKSGRPVTCSVSIWPSRCSTKPATTWPRSGITNVEWLHAPADAIPLAG